MSAPLGVIVIGAGDMGARHARHWAAAGAEVVVVCDPDIARAAAVAGPLGAQAHTSPEAFLELPVVQAVSVCTPTFLHARFAIQALEAHKHVLCEKPVALSLEDALAMKAAAERSGCELRIGFMRRFDPAYGPLLEFVGGLGAPLLAQAAIVAGVRPKPLMHDADANGGPVLDMCCHVFDLWNALFGVRPERVSARGHTFGASKPELAHIQHKALDSAVIVLEYPGGAVGQLLVSWGLPAGIPATEHHTYLGPEGLLEVNWNGDMALVSGARTARWETDGADPWQAEITQFYREITLGAPRRLASIAEGIEALRLSLAALESVATGQSVDLRAARAAAS